jgi:hypothetical protein
VDRDERSDARGASEVRNLLKEHALNTGIVMYHHFSINKNAHINHRNLKSKNSFELKSALYFIVLYCNDFDWFVEKQF